MMSSGHGELTLGNAEFEFISHVVSRNAGISLGAAKRQLVQTRLAQRIRELNLPSFASYCQLLRNSGPEELVALINAVTTNVTAFFRESHHFEALAAWMLPEAMARNAATRRLRIWSAGCSTGEEAWSIAMAAAEVLPAQEQWDLRILATDIDSEALAAAEEGVYPIDRIGSLAEARRRRWLLRGTGRLHGYVRVRDVLREPVTFRALNLVSDWPMQGPFDIVFCRNVMIYFDAATRGRLLQRFAALMHDGGYLCVGHAESLQGTRAPFRLVARTTYRKECH